MKLYKYKKINDFTVEEIINSYLVFSSPFLFNDVFDCQIPVDVSLPANRFPNDLSSMIEKIFYDDMKYIDFLKKKMVPDLENRKVEYFEHVVKKIMERQRITCFTDDFNNFPMWAHYADDNQGLCLEFTIDETEDSFWGFVSKVHYTNEFPMICYPEDLSNPEVSVHQFKEQVLTKHEKWSYENEYRIVLLDSNIDPLPKLGLGKISYNPQHLTAVYFGHNVNAASDGYKKIVLALKQRELCPNLLIRKKNETFFGTHWEAIQ